MIYTVMYNTSTYWRSHLAAVKKQSGRIRLSAAYIFYTFSNRPAVRSCQILWDSRQCHGGGQLMLYWSHSALAIRDRKEKKSPIFVSSPFSPCLPATPPQRPLNATELPPGGPHERSNGRSDLMLACYDARLSSFINNNPESNRLFRPLSVFVSPWHINWINTRHSTSFYARYYHYHTLWMPRTKQNFVTFQLRITYHHALSSSLCLKVAWLRNNGRIEDAKTSVGVCVNT